MTTVTLFAQHCICKRIWNKMNQCWNMLFQETKTKYLNLFLFVWLSCLFFFLQIKSLNNFGLPKISQLHCAIWIVSILKLWDNLQPVKYTNIKYISNEYLYTYVCMWNINIGRSSDKDTVCVCESINCINIQHFQYPS